MSRIDDLDSRAWRELEQMADQRLVMQLNAVDAYCLVSAVQLASRHPTAQGTDLMERAALVARKLLEGIAPDEHSALRVLGEMGWHEQYDDFAEEP